MCVSIVWKRPSPAVSNQISDKKKRFSANYQLSNKFHSLYIYIYLHTYITISTYFYVYIYMYIYSTYFYTNIEHLIFWEKNAINEKKKQTFRKQMKIV